MALPPFFCQGNSRLRFRRWQRFSFTAFGDYCTRQIGPHEPQQREFSLRTDAGALRKIVAQHPVAFGQEIREKRRQAPLNLSRSRNKLSLDVVVVETENRSVLVFDIDRIKHIFLSVTTFVIVPTSRFPSLILSVGLLRLTVLVYCAGLEFRSILLFPLSSRPGVQARAGYSPRVLSLGFPLRKPAQLRQEQEKDPRHLHSAQAWSIESLFLHARFSRCATAAGPQA